MMKLFYSYSHKDEDFRDDMEKHLATLQQGGLIEEWHDRKIQPGQEIQEEIDQNLRDSDAVLLLLSPDFLASSECIKETKRSLDLHDRSQVRVVPVIVRPCAWKENHGLSKLLALPKDGKPISEWDNRDKAFLNVHDGVREILEAMPFSLKREVRDDLTEIEFISHSDENVRLDDFFVLSVLQTYEAFMPRSLQITAYGHCYQALITANLVKSGMQGDDIDSAFNFLGHLAFAMHKNLDKFSRRSLEELLKAYREKYVIGDNVVNRCTKVAKPVVVFRGEQYAFRYPFVNLS